MGASESKCGGIQLFSIITQTQCGTPTKQFKGVDSRSAPTKLILLLSCFAQCGRSTCDQHTTQNTRTHPEAREVSRCCREPVLLPLAAGGGFLKERTC